VTGEPLAADVAVPEAQPSASWQPASQGWFLGDPCAQIPSTAPLHGLLGVAARSVGAYMTQVLHGTGLSPSGFGILRLLAERDGMKPSEVAGRGWSTPATVTSVVDTLVRDGYVERRREDGDRRVVRLYLTDIGRRKCEQAVMTVAPRLSACLDFVDPADEPVIRKFLVDAITRFTELVGEERK
jgi:DNA-binding MarR family transcriptional regulator